MKRTTGFLVALGVTLGACSGSKEDVTSSTGGQSGAASGGIGQEMGGSSAGGSSAGAGALASGGAPTSGGNLAMTGGSNSGGSNSGGASSGGKSNAGGSNSGGASAGSNAGGSNSGGASSGGKSSGGATSGGSSAGSGGSQAGASGSGGSAETCAADLTRANRTLVAKAIDELFIAKDVTAIDRYWSEPYLQHNPIAKSGVTTFRSLMSSFVTSASFQYERLLTLADCELVVVYGRYSQTGVIFDMFRVRSGKIMEHWDSDSNQASDASGVDPLDLTAASAEHRALFTQFAATVLVGGDTARATDYLSSDFIEHRDTAATGPTAFTRYLSSQNQSYTKVHHLIADGNFVFALSEGKRGTAAFGLYDLFRVQGGKLAEHWDSRRAVPSSTMSGLGIF